MCSISEWSRDSFDRFGDDLCELILSYLPLSDCFVLQFVNKQFNAIIFNKQNKFTLTTGNPYNTYVYPHSIVKEIIINFGSTEAHIAINHHLLKYVLNKCANINHLIFYCHFMSDETIQIIINACKRLKHLTIDMIPNNVSLNCWKQFAEKSLQNLRALTVYDVYGNIEITSTLILLCPTLKALHYKSIKLIDNCGDSELCFDRCFKTNTVFGANIDSVKYYMISDDKFITFTNHFAHQLKSLSVLIDFKTCNNRFELMKNLAKFESLEYLCCEFKCGEENYCIELLKLIGLKCKRLRVLELIDLKLDIKEAFNNGFKSIEKLILIECKIFNTFEYLKNCLNLKRLELYDIHSDGSHFNNIHTNLPQLKSIEFIYDSDVKKFPITENPKLISIIKHLEKMSTLCDLKIGCYNMCDEEIENCSVTTDEVLSFIDNCLSIRRIGIYSTQSILNKPIIEEYIQSNNRKIIIETLKL